ncbi:MAG: hypothetical protein PUB70_05340 [Bacteroidales bacterium]|nr:hypothetical protein [Bacteroidales bacterium]MDD6509045.1 hypothetical protein [Bacteroidales bacterium]MDD6809688.1 hypothetical protein [Bacteroidales bacterium]
MKHIFRYLGVTLLLAGIISACSPEKITHPSEAGIPSATQIEPVISVDQEINQVTFALPAGTKGLIPVWLFQDKTGDWTQYSAQNGLKKIFTTAGDYSVRMHLMNSNGMSPDFVQKTFHIDNTIMNFDKYNTMLTGGSQKEWRIDNSVAGHMGCGPSGTSGTEWWSANPDDKKDWGVYDNRMTFVLEGNVYQFDPGAAGTIYVNTGISSEPYGSHNTNDGKDYLYPVEAQTAEWSWEVDGEDLYLILPANTYWPYYANVDFIANPRFKVESISTKSADLVIDNGEIAWHFTITSGAAEVKFNGFNYNHEANLWKPVDAEGAHSYSFFYAPGWTQIADPEVSCAGGKYTFSLPSATSEQWQAQCFIIPTTDLPLSAATNYDFSCILNSSTDIKKVTLKLTDTTNDGNFLFTENVNLTAFEDYVFYLSDLTGIDAAAVKMVFDFGGNPDNTEISVSNIVLKDHAIDDGTVLPSVPEDPVAGPEEYKYDSEANLWKAADGAHSCTFFYAPSWNQLPDPELANNGNEYLLKLPSATFAQWQAQFHIIPDSPVALESSKSYDFSVVLNSTTDIRAVTLKLTENGNDDNFLFTENVNLTAFEDYIFDLSDLPGIDAAAVKMVFDFGGNPDNTEVTIKRIVLKDHAIDDGTHKGGASGENPGGGLDTSGTDIWDNAKVSYTWWYSMADWSGTLTPEISTISNGWKVVIPAGIGGSEWQGQTHFTLDAPASAAKKYDFCVTLNSSAACTCTVKLAWEGNDTDHAFFYDGNVALSAYEDFQYIQSGVSPDADYDKLALFIDLGRTPAGAEVEIKDIHLYEH